MKVTDRLKQLIFKHLYKELGNCEIIPITPPCGLLTGIINIGTLNLIRKVLYGGDMIFLIRFFKYSP